MKLLHFIFILGIFVFLLGCKAKVDVELEKSNPLEGTTWEVVSYEAKGDTVIKLPQSEFDRAIAIYGKTHYALVNQDTSRQSTHFVIGTYNFMGDSCTYTVLMYPYYEDIGRSFTYKVQIEGDKMVITGGNEHSMGYDWKTIREEWKKMD